MTRAETLRILTLLAQITGPAPEGDAWDLTAQAWSAILVDVAEADMLRAVKAYVTGGPGRAPGTWWPRPGDLLALIRPAELTHEQAWAHIRPQLGGAVGIEGLTAIQITALGSLPGSYDRARMLGPDLDRLRGRYLAACGAAEARAANRTPATVIPLRPEPPRLVETPPPQQMPAKGHRSAAEPAAMGEPTPRAETRQNGPARPADGACAMPAGLTEAELRQRARGKVAEVRARFGGGR